jgi:zinc transport system substrate-binding protein
MRRQFPVCKWLLGFAFVGLLALMGWGCGKPEEDWPEGKSPRIVTSFPPVYCFAANVAGDDAAVFSLLTNQGPHDYRARPSDSKKLMKADVFFINGLGLDETFSNQLKYSAGNAQLRFVELGEALENLHKPEQNDPAHAGHSHGDHDPHVWLGIPEAIKMVQVIRDTLKEVAPAKAAQYDQNAATYIQKLEQIHTDGKAALANKKNRKIVTFHESLFYFARSFGLEIVGTIQVRPGSEPSPSKLAELVKVCRDQGVRVITVEPQYPDNTAAKTLVDEVGGGIKTVVVDPLETASKLTPATYEEVMRENLRKLAEALP